MNRALVMLLTFAMAAAAQESPPKENPHTSGADLERGARLYSGHCAPCHGPKGEGARGAPLARPKLRRAADDQALFRVIENGISGTDMPGAWQMTPREIWQVVAHIRALGRTAVEIVPGDSVKGEQLFGAKGNCTQCHTIKGKGGTAGPELSEIGSRRGADHLRTSMLDPEAATPEGFLQVVAVTRSGKSVTGIRLNEDTDSIQLRDLAGGLHSFWKADLKRLDKEKGRSPMPSYKGVLSNTEIADLTAYLASLRGVL